MKVSFPYTNESSNLHQNDTEFQYSQHAIRTGRCLIVMMH